MKNILIVIACIFILSACASTQTQKTESNMSASYFNAELANKLGADDYGMRSYVLAILKTGPNDKTITDEAKRKELFSGHFSNMGRLAEEGKLLLAGPLDGQLQRRGIFVFNVASIEEAEAIVKTDPSIAAGIFAVELHKYYGSAALMQVNEVHQQIQKTKIQ